MIPFPLSHRSREALLGFASLALALAPIPARAESSAEAHAETVRIPILTSTNLDALGPPLVVNLAGETHHVQGIEIEGDRLWVTSVNRKAGKGFLMEFKLPESALALTGSSPAFTPSSAPATELSAPMTRSVEVQNGERIHPGGLQGDAESLWLPVAPYRRGGPSRIEQRSKATLEVLFTFEAEDHIGCLAVDAERLIGGNWDTRKLYVWNRKGELLRVADNPTPNAFQDMKLVEGRLAGGGTFKDSSKKPAGAVDWLDPESMTPLRRLTVGVTSRGQSFTHEGMAIAGGRLMFLPEDGPSRLFIFRAPAWE